MQRAREALILNEIEREAWQTWMAAFHRQTLVKQTARVSQEEMRHISDIFDDKLNRLGKVLMPWGKWLVTDEDKKEAQAAKMAKAKRDYESAFGPIKGRKMQDVLKRTRFFLLADRIAGRARRERRKLTEVQKQWLKDATDAQQGNSLAWSRISNYNAGGIIELFEASFDRKAVRADVKAEIGDN